MTTPPGAVRLGVVNRTPCPVPVVERTRRARIGRALGSARGNVALMSFAVGCNLFGWVGWVASGTGRWPWVEACGVVVIVATVPLLVRMQRRAAFARAIPPCDIQVQFRDGRRVPVECMYTGTRKGVHEWRATTPVCRSSGRGMRDYRGDSTSLGSVR